MLNNESEKQFYKEPLKNVRNHQTHERNLQKKSKNIKGKVFFAFSLATSLLATGFGLNYVSENDLGLKSPKEDSSVKSLKFLQHNDEIAMVDTNQKLNVRSTSGNLNQEIDPYQRNIELEEELKETKNRLQQLKNDILIRGGNKEIYYKDFIDQLESNLQDAEEEIQLLRNELMDRTSLLQSKNSENEELSKRYLEENKELRRALENSFKEYEYDLDSSREALDNFMHEMKLTDDEKRSFEYIEESIDAIRGKILGLESELKETNAKLEEERDRVKNLTASLTKYEEENLKAQKHIDILSKQLKQENERYALLENGLNESVLKAYSSTKPLTDLDQVKIRLTGQEARASVLEKQLLVEIGQKKNAREQAIALENELNLYKNDKKSSTPNSLTEQEKIIRDLSHSLHESELRNLKLQQTLDDMKVKNDSPSNDDYKNLKYSINKKLQNAQNNIDEIEAEFAGKTSSNYDDFLIEDDTTFEDSQIEKMKIDRATEQLNAEIEMLKKQNQEIKEAYEHTLKEKDQKIHELMKNQKNQSEASKNNVFQASLEQNQSLHYQKIYETEIRNLKNELLKTKQDLHHLQNNDIAYNEEFPINSIKMFENALNVQTEALLAAQEEILRSRNEDDLNQKEIHYLSTIKQLTEKNRILEKEFAEAEDYLSLTRDQYADDQQKNLSLKNIMEEKDQKIAYLEQELASLESGDPTIYFNRLEDEKRLQGQLSKLNEALNKERNRRSSIENEVAILREELLKHQFNFLAFESNNQIGMPSQSSDDKESEIAELEERLLAMVKWNERLQDELAAHESERDFNSLVDMNPDLNPTLIKKMQTEIAYLTKRVEQEKEKYFTLEEKVKEMGVSYSEMQQRNNLMEKKIRQAGLKIF